ncbi:C2 domain-containing protein [Streptomyces roseolilacinus]|uniref:hypothetical protein n=1 Tax=Streptomyces roseolilacinus TaxID=66904 RepID=UPI00382F72FD
MQIDLEFGPNQHEMTIDLYDQEDIGRDDYLGGVVIGDNSSPIGQIQRHTIAHDGAVYELTYAIGERANI